MYDLSWVEIQLWLILSTLLWIGWQIAFRETGETRT